MKRTKKQLYDDLGHTEHRLRNALKDRDKYRTLFAANIKDKEENPCDHCEDVNEALELKSRILENVRTNLGREMRMHSYLKKYFKETL